LHRAVIIASVRQRRYASPVNRVVVVVAVSLKIAIGRNIRNEAVVVKGVEAPMTVI
jgi:hypothetical protein